MLISFYAERIARKMYTLTLEEFSSIRIVYSLSHGSIVLVIE